MFTYRYRSIRGPNTHLRTFSENCYRPDEFLSTIVRPEDRLTRAKEKIRVLKDLIQSHLQPEIEALKRENHALKEKANSSCAKNPSKLSVSNQTDDRDKSGELIHVIEHLEKRFFQSESILKKSIENLKQQLDQERKAKSKLQLELDSLVRDLDHGINHLGLNPHENTQVQAQEAKAEALLHMEIRQIKESYQQELEARVKSLEIGLKEQYARDVTQILDNFDVERVKGSAKITPNTELKKCNDLLTQTQMQNRFLLQLLEEKGTLVRTLSGLLEVRTRQQERTRSQDLTVAGEEIEQLKKVIGEMVRCKEAGYSSELQVRNASLAAKLAVRTTQKTEKKMRETQKFYSGELSQLNRMLNGLKSARNP